MRAYEWRKTNYAVKRAGVLFLIPAEETLWYTTSCEKASSACLWWCISYSPALLVGKSSFECVLEHVVFMEKVVCVGVHLSTREGCELWFKFQKAFLLLNTKTQNRQPDEWLWQVQWQWQVDIKKLQTHLKELKLLEVLSYHPNKCPVT